MVERDPGLLAGRTADRRAGERSSVRPHPRRPARKDADIGGPHVYRDLGIGEHLRDPQLGGEAVAATAPDRRRGGRYRGGITSQQPGDGERRRPGGRRTKQGTTWERRALPRSLIACARGLALDPDLALHLSMD